MYVLCYALLLVLNSHLVFELDLLDSDFLFMIYFLIMAVGCMLCSLPICKR